MPERYPDDAALLTLEQDPATGVEYIPTGQSPYYLAFRRLIQRALLSTQRANDLRVYQEDDLQVGLRSGRCFIGDTALDVAATEGIAMIPNTTTHLWVDAAGSVQTGTAGLPADRATFIPLAQITTGASTITEVSDLRGETFLQAGNPQALGLTATADEINQALNGISANVTAAKLSALTGGSLSIADAHHGHNTFVYDTDATAYFNLINDNTGTNTNIAVRLSLPEHLGFDTALSVNKTNGLLQQTYSSNTFNLVGATHQAFTHEGALTATLTNKLVGVVPIDGTVTDVILCTGTNLQSSTSTDNLSATAKVNSTSLCNTNPSLASVAGAGFRCTDQGDGVTAVVKSDGTQNVSRGDLLTVDITRTAAGTVSIEAADVAVLVVIRVNQPE